MAGFLKITPYYIYTALLLLLCTSCINEKEPSSANDIAVGDRLPQFEVTLNDGTTVSTKDLEGKKSVIVFFNTLCGDCRDELPVLQQAYEEAGSEAVFICISREEGKEAVQKFWDENSLTLPYSAQETRDVYNLFASNVIPRLYIADKDLVVTHVFTDNPIATKEEIINGIRK